MLRERLGEDVYQSFGRSGCGERLLVVYIVCFYLADSYSAASANCLCINYLRRTIVEDESANDQDQLS
jgi:hypothetical protein